ncbi:MAG: hypothetical protein Q9198_000366 [Flavoplaca austrocitrina]
MASTVQGVQNIIGYTFNDSDLVREAVSAAGSIVAAGTRRFPNGNKRLAILGDTVLQLALAEEWYDGIEPRATYDRIRQAVGSNNNLHSIGLASNLDAFVNLAAGGRTVSPITMAATVEAIIGAVYLDANNMDTVKAVMDTLGLTAASLG